MKFPRSLFIVFLAFAFVTTVPAQRQMEKLGRGVVAVRTGTSSAYVGWRLLGNDPDNTGFNLYRTTNGVMVKLNGALLTNTTDYADGSVNFAVTNFYFVEPVMGGVTQAVSVSYALPASAPTQQYLNIPLTPPPGGTSPDAADGTGPGGPYTYNANDCSVGDVDGDGEYEIIVKWDPSNSKDNSQSGFTGDTFLDCYKLNGTRLWRIDLGPNIRSGAHYMDFMVFDYDGDGKAELMCRTAPGSKDGLTNYVGGIAKWQNANGAHPVFNDTNDYRITGPNGVNGYVLAGPEFLTVFNGLTGEEMATATFYPKRDPDNNDDNPTASRIDTIWGDNYGNRIDRFLAGVAYVDGQRPSAIFCRGYYTRAYLTAWDWRNGTLTRRWTFDSENTNPDNSAYRGQGAHSLSIGDADGDGKDEIVYGAASIDDDGKGLYSTGLGHGDAEHFSDMDPWRPGKEIWMVHESPGSYGPNGLEYRDAKTGALIFGVDGQGADVGRGVAYDIDPRYRGYEMWGARGGLMSATGVQITSSRPGQMNFCVWWDSDLLRETLDGTTIYKWNWLTSVNSSVFSPGGLSSNNGTKSTPCISADLFGDWREEVIWRTSDNLNLRIYTTTSPATNRIYTLMHDPQYRCAIAWQNTGYNQPPHPGFFIGQDMFTPPLAPVSDAKLLWRGDSSNIWDIGTTANWTTNNIWTNANPVTIYHDGDSVLFDLTGSNNPAITLATPLVPGNVTVYSYKDYTFVGEALTGAMTLKKAGNAILTLNNTNDYTGQTIVSDGTLRVNGVLMASPVIARWPGIVGGAGTLGGGLTLQRGSSIEPGAIPGSAGAITISNTFVEAGETMNYFNLSDDPTGTTKTNDIIQVFGNVSLSGSNSVLVSLLDGQPGFGAYGLISYSGSLAGSVSNLNVSGLDGEIFYLTNATGLISLVLPSHRAPLSIFWIGGGANNWDLATTANWSGMGGVQKFFPDDVVRFDNAGSTTVNVTGSLRPGSIVVDSTNNYTLGGSGVIVGAGGLLKTNSGTLTINSTANTFTGRTILGGGVVVVSTFANGGTPSPIGSAGNASSNLVFTGGTLRYTGGTASTDRRMMFNVGGGTLDISSGSTDFTLVGALTGSGSLTKTGAGSVSISAANTYSGGTIVRQGTLSLGAAVANTSGLGIGSVTLTNDALLDFFASGSGDTSAGGPFTNAVIVPTNTSASINLPFRISIRSTLTGGGTLNLRVNGSRDELFGDWSAFTGQINVTSQSGVSDFRCNNTNGYPFAKLNLGSSCTLQNRISGTPTISIGELSGSSSSTIVATGGSNGLDVNWSVGGLNTSSTFAGNTTNNVALTKVGTGTLTLSGTGYHTGTTTVNGGTLLINGNYSSASGAVTVGAAGTLGGTGTIGGATTVNGTVSPGTSLGTLTFANNLTLNPSSTTFIEIRKSPPGSDLADVAGTLTYGGALVVTNLAGTLTNGESFKIFDAATYNSSFSSFSLPTLATNLSWITSNLTINGTLSVSGAGVTNPPTTNQTLIWKGDGSANVWDTATTLNWLDASNNTAVFNTNDSVNFTDIGSNNVAVALIGTLRPAALTINATKNYTFGSTGLIAGTNTLAKSGTGTLTLTNIGNNTYSGGVTINGGIVALGPDSAGAAVFENQFALGTGPATINSGGQLRFGGRSGNNAQAYFITNAIILDGGGIFSVDSDQHLSNSVVQVNSGGGTLLTRWGGKDLFIESKLTGSGALVVNNGGGGGSGGMVYFSNPQNTYNGTIMVQTNAIALSNPNALSNAIVNVSGTGTSSNLFWFGVNSIVLGGLSGGGNIPLGGNQLVVGHNGSSTIYSGVLSGTGSLAKNGAGTFTLAGTNTYTGTTIVSNGTLLVHGNNLPATGALTILNGATLGGNGSIGGATTIQSGGKLAPGASIGIIAFTNMLVLSGTTVMEIGHSPLTNDMVIKSGTLTNGGVLMVTNIGGALAAGDGFKLFNAANYAGSFSGVTLPSLLPGLGWDTSGLNTNGILRVVVVTVPRFGAINFESSGLVFIGTGGVANASYYVLGSTNAALPSAQWTRIATNLFDGFGNFMLTNAIDSNEPAFFYRLQIP